MRDRTFRIPVRSSQETPKVVPLFPAKKLKLGSFAVAIGPSRKKGGPRRQRRTNWQLVPLRVDRVLGESVERMAIRWSTDSVIPTGKSTSSNVYRIVCLSTVYRDLQSRSVKIA